jgi:septin family protein
MDRFEEVGQEIVDFVNAPRQKMERLIAPWRGTRFVVCGTSGSGKTRAIDFANSLLPESEQIAESREIVRKDDPKKAVEILNDAELEYEASLHIAFTVYYTRSAKALELEGVKVFWLDRGSSGTY